MTIIETIQAIAQALGRAALPAQIAHPFGRYLLRNSSGGASSYELQLEDTTRPKTAALVQSHTFDQVESMLEWMAAEPADRFNCAFLHVEKNGNGNAVLRGTNTAAPEGGLVHCTIERHPAWQAWTRVVRPHHNHCDLSHTELADLLLDREDDLVEPMLAKVIAQFYAVRTVEYDADMAGGSQGVRVRWTGRGGAPGAAGQVGVPREIAIRIPVFTGPWPALSEPRTTTSLRVRVVPGGEDARPMFRVSWADLPGLEIDAAEKLEDRVNELISERVEGMPLFMGVPNAKSYVLPE